MAKKRTGLRTLAYMGVNASTPPQFVAYDRAPTVSDYSKFDIGTIWLYDTTPTEIWMLTNKAAHVSTWTQINSGGVGTISSIVEGNSISVTNPTGPAATVAIGDTLSIPATNAAGTAGVIYIDSTEFIHAMGVQNSFLGTSAGNLALNTANARRNVGLGFQALTSNVHGENNVAVGDSSMATIESGDRNVAVGHGTLDQATDVDFNVSVGGDGLTQLLTGDYNVTLGYRSGFNYVGNESSNVLIANEGTATEANVIRIGTQGAGAGQQDTCFIAGIHGVAVGGVNEIMYIDNAGQIGSSIGNDGQLLIGATGASPAWADVVSGDGTVTISTGANTLDLRAVGGGAGGAATFITDTNSPAVIAGANITFAGAGVLNADGGGGSNTVTYSITNGANGEVLIGGGAAAAWSTLTAGAGINIVEAANTITISAPGAGGGSTTFPTDVGTATVAGGNMTIAGGTNLNTAGAGATVTVNLDDSITLPDTNAAGTQGLYALGSGTTFMHNYGAAGTSYNTFLGQDAGNLTHTNSVDSTGLGYESLNSLTTGDGNTAVASGSAKDLTTGANNCSYGLDSLNNANAADDNCTIGTNSFNAIITGSSNIGLGTSSGSSCTAADSSNILIGHIGSGGLNNTIMIGTQGAGAGQQNSTFMAGIHNITPSGATEFVIIDANGELGSTDVLGDVTDVDGGTNITTVNPAGPVVTVNLDPSITLAGSLFAGTFVEATTTVTAGTGITCSAFGAGIVQSDGAGVFSSSLGVPLSINFQTGTTYTLILTDASKEVSLTNAVAITLTVPLNASVAFPVGTQIILVQGGAGTVTVAGAIGVTINSTSGFLSLFEQYSAAALIKQATDTWILVGDLK